MVLQIILADISLVARIFPRPCGARKNTTQLVKYPRVLSVKPSKKVYILHAKKPRRVPLRDGIIGNASVNSSCAHPPPGNCGAFARIVSPGGWALAYPRATPGLLTHTWFLTRNPNEDDFIGKNQ